MSTGLSQEMANLGTKRSYDDDTESSDEELPDAHPVTPDKLKPVVKKNKALCAYKIAKDEKNETSACKDFVYHKENYGGNLKNATKGCALHMSKYLLYKFFALFLYLI